MTPTPGRILHYWPSQGDKVRMAIWPDQPLAAVVACVVGDNCVNLQVLDHEGYAYVRKNVHLHQGEGQRPPLPYCEWPVRSA
jgi:hypothetical protein